MKLSSVWITSFSIGGAIALLSLLNYFPGFLYTDSFIRWDQAASILDGDYLGGNFLTITPSLLFSLILLLAGSPAAFSFLQAMFLCSAFVACMFAAGGKDSRWICSLYSLVLYCSTPIFIAYGLTHAPGVGVAVAIVALTVVLLAHKTLNFRFVNTLLMTVMLSFICFGFRQNSLILLPVFVLFLTCFTTFSRFQKIILAASLLAVTIFVSLLPNIMYWKTSNQLAKSIAWEMACLVKEDTSKSFDGYLEPLGISEKAITEVDCGNLLTLNGPTMSTTDDVRLIYSLYGDMALSEPQVFLRNKLRVWARVMGLHNPLEVTQVINDWPKLAEYGGHNQTDRRNNFVNYYHRFHEELPLFRTPYVVFIGALLALLVSLKVGKDKLLKKVMLGLFVASSVYYLSFFIVAQRHEFRYFFPSLYIYSIVFGMSLLVVLRTVSSRRLNRMNNAMPTIRFKLTSMLPSLLLAAPILWVLGVAAYPRLSNLFQPNEFSVQTFPLSDANWHKGVALQGNRNILLIKSTTENLSLFRSVDRRHQVSAGDQSVSVETVRMDNEWIHVHLDTQMLDPNVWGSPNSLNFSNRNHE